MSTSTHTPLLTTEEALQSLRERLPEYATHYFAMYSSVVGGIVTDPTLMQVPLDDHMVHRGHGVFDTASLANGMLYQLEPHLDRFIGSAGQARISLPFSRSELRGIIIDTAAASGQRNAAVRYWLSAGPGGFGIAPDECPSSAFYVIVFEGKAYPSRFYTEGMKVVTSSVPIKAPLFARVKSTNYLPNALVVLEARDKGADNGIFVDVKGMVAESSNMNVAFVSRDRVFRHPPFDGILAGITVQRVMVLAQRLVREGLLQDIKVADVSLQEGRAAGEMLLVGSAIKVAPVVEWDRQPIGDGRPGPVAQRLLELWREDVACASDQLTPVPYRD